MLALIKAALSVLAALGNALGLYMQQKQAKEVKEARVDAYNKAQAEDDSISSDPASAWMREFGPSAKSGVAQDGTSAEADKAGT